MNAAEPPPDEVRLLEWANIVLAHRWLIAVLAIGAGAIAYGLCKMAQPQYTAETTFITNRDAETLSLDRVFNLGLTRAQGSMLDRFAATLVASYYVELLRSDRLLGPMVGRTWSRGQTLGQMYNLKERPGIGFRRQALEVLRRQVVDVRQDRATGMLSLQCTTPDPIVSAEMANALVADLVTFLVESRTSGTQELLQMAEARTSETALQLQHAEDELREFRNRNKNIISPDLKLREGQLEREVKVQETLFIKLKTEVELLRISRQQSVEPITIIQPAEVPMWKSWPPTRAAALGAAVFGMLFGVMIAFIRHGVAGLAARDAGGFEEFVRHMRALNRLLPGVVFLLPREARRRPRAPDGQARQVQG